MFKKHGEKIFISIVAIFMLFFFSVINPYVPFDADDWIHSTVQRSAFPIAGVWNPARVLPEIVMPIAGNIAGTIIYPITKNYTLAMTISHTIFTVFFVTLYIWAFFRMLKKFNLDNAKSAILTALFTFLHLATLRNSLYRNHNLFTTNDITTTYFYLIPNLLAGMLIFYVISKKGKNILEKGKPLKNGFLLLASYITTFSNLFCVILVSYSLSAIIFDFFKNRKLGFIKNTAKTIKENIFYVISVVFFAVSAFFETTGGRAADFTSSSLIVEIKKSIKNLILIENKLNIFIVILLCAVFLAGIFLAIKERKTIIKSDFFAICAKLFLSAILSSIMLVLLCARVAPEYLTRADIFFPIFFFVFVLFSMILVEISKKHNQIWLFLPIIAFVAFFEIRLFNVNTFVPPVAIGTDPKIASELSEDLVQQIIEASKSRKSNFELKVPHFEAQTNWPMTKSFGTNIAYSLYDNGIIEKLIEIETVIDPEINKKYGL